MLGVGLREVEFRTGFAYAMRIPERYKWLGSMKCDVLDYAQSVTGECNIRSPLLGYSSCVRFGWTAWPRVKALMKDRGIKEGEIDLIKRMILGRDPQTEDIPETAIFRARM